MTRLFGSACIALMLLGPVPGWAEEMRQILVTGTGSVETVPDMAVITLGVTHENKQARAAMDEVSGTVAQMLKRLSDLGIEPRDVQTRQFSLNPVWNDRSGSYSGRGKISGFVASNAVMVRVRKLDDLGRILDAVIEDGANDFNGLQFTVQDPKPLLDTARKAAVADAMARAALLAEAAGVTLGPVRSITDQGGGGAEMFQMDMAARASAPVAAGEVTLSASMQMVFEIAD